MSLAAAGAPSSSPATSHIKVSPAPETPRETASPNSSSTSVDISQLVPWKQISQLIPWERIGQGIQALGLSKFPSLYEQGEDTHHHTLTLYLGPGDDSAFLRDLHAFLNAPIIKSTGITPKITIVRVPTGPDAFAAASKAYTAAIPRLIAAGFHPTTSDPDIKAGTYDVALSAAPKGMTTADATAYLRKTVSPLIRVTSVNAPQVEEFRDRATPQNP